MSRTTRVNFDVPVELNRELGKMIPRGLRAEVYRCLLETLARDLKRKGFIAVIGPLTENKATITTVHPVNIPTGESQ